MAKNYSDEELRKMEERRDLLKMKQGIIEESDLIPETGYEKIPELHGWAKIKNYIYHYKWLYLVITLAAAMVTFLIVQAATVEREDLHVLLISSAPDSDLSWHMNSIETALEKYCPDFDNNGYVHVGVSYIDVSSENGGTYYIAQLEKLSSELYAANGQFIISEESLWEVLVEKNRFTSDIFCSFSEQYPDKKLYKDCGIYINDTDFAETANWDKCPDNVAFFIRAPLENGAQDKKETAEQRQRSLTVLENIIRGNIVNPQQK